MFFAAYLGYFAALGTSFAWSFTSVFFTLSGRIVGSPIVNRTRLLLAIGFVLVTHRLMQGTFLPVTAQPHHIFWLALSGFIGYVFGDGMLFQAFVMIGPRLSMLLMALVPVFSTVMAWALLNEVLARLELFGIALTVSGVMLVVGDRSNGRARSVAVTEPRQYFIGVLFGLGGALGQSGGLLASRMGLADGFPALSGNIIRIITAAIILWAFALVRGRVRPTFGALRANPQALKYITGGAIFGPFLGVWFSLVAVQFAPLGIASTLMSLTPVILLPISRVLFGEAITRRAVLGTIVAFVGTGILFL